MKIKTNKFFAGAAVAVALVLSISSCKKDDDNDPQATGSITFVNTVEGSSAQDAYVDDTKTSASGIAYGSSSGTVAVTPGSRTVSFKNSGSATANASGTVNVGENTSTTVFLVKNSNNTMSISTYANDNTAVTASGKAKIRFVNAAPLLASAINVTLSTGASLVSALTYNAASAYQTVDANTAINVNMTGSAEVTTIAGSEIQAGKVYTIWFDNATSTKVKYHIVVQN